LVAKCALAIKDFSILTMIYDKISRNVYNSKDALTSSFILMSALTHSRISESVEHDFQVLHDEFGIDIPNSATQEDTLKLIIQTEAMLNRIPEETLLSYHALLDPNKVMVLKFLIKLESFIQQVNPALVPFVTIKIVELTIEHGLSPMSAIGFAYFGGMIAELGEN